MPPLRLHGLRSEYLYQLVLRPFGSDTLAVVAYNFTRDERPAEAALPSLAIVAVGLIPVVMPSRALRAPAD